MIEKWRTRLKGFVLALLVTTLSGSLIQTQFNLAAIAALGAEISLTTRLTTSVHDLLGFAPLYAGLVAAVLAAALPLAALVRRWLALPAGLLYPLAAALGLWLALLVVDALAPMPTLIAATRSLSGTLAMLGGAALGGLVYACCRAGRTS
ncbi:hypothetical protein [Halomonas salipaludis]|uniref:Uncharacterized protein n=1 Tax=Halomonas salipaludis TaxID=2032625 RepID=A0A2A2ENQ2_9GAMM|nr:hypothetical protein [Halomonas salipaludis]PAU75081.1 hypothetical protein CK498_18185 [Halomonas salipaludis]